jgi:hypothetical protein
MDTDSVSGSSVRRSCAPRVTLAMPLGARGLFSSEVLRNRAPMCFVAAPTTSHSYSAASCRSTRARQR